MKFVSFLMVIHPPGASQAVHLFALAARSTLDAKLLGLGMTAWLRGKDWRRPRGAGTGVWGGGPGNLRGNHVEPWETTEKKKGVELRLKKHIKKSGKC